MEARGTYSDDSNFESEERMAQREKGDMKSEM